MLPSTVFLEAMMLVIPHGAEIPEELQAWINGYIGETDPNEPVLFQPLEPQLTCNLNDEDEPDNYNAVLFEGQAWFLIDIAALVQQSTEHTGLLFVIGSEESPMLGAINGHETEVEILE